MDATFGILDPAGSDVAREAQERVGERRSGPAGPGWRRRASTVRATGWLALHGIRARRVACEGRLPRLWSEGEVRLGEGVVFRAITMRAEVGARRGGRLELGAGTLINQGVVLVATGSIRIGANVALGDLVAVYDTDYHPVGEWTPVRRGPVVVGDNVWLGRGAIVLPGVVIGDNSVVGAASVVTGDVPPDCVVAGSPARVVGAVECSEGWVRR